MGWLREDGILESRVKKIAPERVPKLLKKARARAERMVESPRKKWLLAKIKEFEGKPPEEVLENAILFVIIFLLLGLIGAIIGAALVGK